ncbi:hypothetical protein CYY_001844 [Polysphondylium violaceum]|uniref:Fungal lipase-type domain-containing protein n=1 Tax=Polysphondylium violaceum TaxID=133409 RepID=A0A8J4V7I7_9MYCE|nr:hypothetical protein CYY_001844 [Polysphondylium violaceum]
MKILFLALVALQLLLLCNNGFVQSNSYPDINYDPNTAESFLMYSYAAYCEGPDISNWTCPTCSYKTMNDFKIVNLIYNATTDTQAYVGYYGNNVLVVFRGSMDVYSWITNLQFLYDAYPFCTDCYVHSGFHKAWLSVRSEIEASVANSMKLCGPKCGLIVTGHSLGGALATLAMAELIQIYKNIPTFIYTFGSPRVGNDNFASYYNSIQPNNYRTVNQHDLVPHVPTEVMQYHHVPTEVWYTSNGTYQECNDSGEDPSCSDSITNPATLSIYDHLHYFNIHCCCRDFNGSSEQ